MSYPFLEQLILLWTVQVQFWSVIVSAISIAIAIWTKRK